MSAGWRLVGRTLLGLRCESHDPRLTRRSRCVFEIGHDGLHGAPAGFGYRWWR